MPDNKKPIPVYVNHMPPCNHFCPVGNDIQKILFLVNQSDCLQAWRTLMENNPLPAVTGRVCEHPCENHCNRFGFDSAINIKGVERYLGDMALEKGWKVEAGKSKYGEKILIVGAGPAGLAVAYHLTLLGYEAVIYEASSIAGGTMHTGIPRYRLPRNILDAEIKRIADMGVKFDFNHKVTDVIAERDQGKFAAVFIGVGCQKSRNVNIPNSGAECKIIQAMKFLTDIEFKCQDNVTGKRVLVYGGGNTAFDAARSAVRFGAKSVGIVYRRAKGKMPAYDFEISEAVEEGVELRCLRTIKQIDKTTVWKLWILMTRVYLRQLVNLKKLRRMLLF
jgi:formate dehydrogenase beta subunit